MRDPLRNNRLVRKRNSDRNRLLKVNLSDFRVVPDAYNCNGNIYGILDDMLLLDLDSEDPNGEDKAELSEKDLLISDFLSTMSSSVQPTSSMMDVDDLFSLDEPSQPKNSFQSDLFDIFEAQNAAPTQDQNPC